MKRLVTVAVPVLAVALLTWSALSHAQQKQPSASREKTVLISCPADDAAIEVKATDRAEVKKDLFVDLVGIRLYVADAASRTRINQRFANPAGARNLVVSTVGNWMAMTGVEPDPIPVRGEEGKKMGTEDMVLLAGGEFSRTGEYYDSTGGDGPPRSVRSERYRIQLSSFCVDKFKVSNEDYCKFLNDGNASCWMPWNPRIARAPSSGNTKATALCGGSSGSWSRVIRANGNCTTSKPTAPS